MARLALKVLFTRAPSLASASLLLALVLLPITASAATLSNRSLMLTNNIASATSTYQTSFTLGGLSQSLGSIVFQFCSNSSLLVDPCDAPSGMDTSGAVLASQSGEAGFSITPSGSPNEIIISRTPALPVVSGLEYEFNNISNPSSNGSYFLRIQTFTGQNGTGSGVDQGGLAFAINIPVNIQAQVPPYITFCVGTSIPVYTCDDASGNYIDFGELSTIHAVSGKQQMLIATNAKSGFAIYLSGHTMTSGNNTINPLTTSSRSRPGVSQFGLNLRANSDPSVGADPTGPGSGTVAASYDQPDIFHFSDGQTVASSSGPSDYRKFTASYIINIAKGQPAGDYATTITYIAVGNF